VIEGLTMKEAKESSVREAWILCLILGIVMINFPFVHIFNIDRLIFGIPELVLYFFIGWPASIVVIWFFVGKMKTGNTPGPGDGDNG
jgi:hypothetical protein